MFDTPTHHIASILVDVGESRDWMAGGADILIVASDGKIEEIPMPGWLIENFLRLADGSSYAVGTDGAIWSGQNTKGLKLEHSEPRSRDRRKHLLTSLYEIETPEGSLVLARGGVTYVLERNPRGGWQVIQDQALLTQRLTLSMHGPSTPLPGSCDNLQWRWISPQSGLLLCRDLRAFLWQDAKLSPIGRMPAKCDIMGEVVRRGDELFTSCGTEGWLLRYNGQWERVDGMGSVRAISANLRCVAVTTNRTVYRHCRPST